GDSCAELLVQFLQAVYLAVTAEIQRVHQRAGTGHGRGIRDAMLQCLAPDRERVGDRLLALGGVDDVDDFAVLDRIDDMRTSLEHLVDTLAGHSMRGQITRRTR